MGSSGSRSAQELHRSPPCTRLQSLDPTRRLARPAVGSPKCRHGLPKVPAQQCRGLQVQKSTALRKGEMAVARLRAGCENVQGYGDVSWPTAPAAGVKAHQDPGRHQCLQRGDGPLHWKAGSEVAQLTAVKQSVDKPAPLPRPRSARQPEAAAAARKSAVGYVVERWPAAAWPPSPPPPPEPPPPAAAHRPDAGPQQRACREVSASYAGSSTSSRSSLAPDDSGISSSPSRVSLESLHDDCEGEMFEKPRSPRPPAWKVRGFREDQIPNDLHHRFCEEIKSRHQLQTEDDRRRRLLAIRRIDAMVSERMAYSLGREIPPPHSSLRRRPKRFWAASGNRGGESLRSHFSSPAAEGKSGNSEGRKSARCGRDDITAVRRRAVLDQYPEYMLTNSYEDRLQQEAETNHYRSLNDAIIRQLPENYALENNQEEHRVFDIFSKKLTMKSDNGDAHKTNMCLKQIKEKRSNRDEGDMPHEWGNCRGETEYINRTIDPYEFQRMIGRNKRYGQNENESTVVDDWYGEELHGQEENERDNRLLQDGRRDQNDIEDVGTETPQRNLHQSDSRNTEEGNVLAQNSTTSDLAGRALRSKDNMVMQLLLGGYFKHEHIQPCWPRIGAVRRTTNQLDVSIRSYRDPVEKQSVETQTLPVHVSRRLPHLDEPRVPLAPKIEIDHRGGLTRYYSLGRECSVGSLASTGSPGSPRHPSAAADARLPDNERMPSYMVPERPPPPPPPPPPSCASQRSHSDHSSHAGGPNAQWISPNTAFISSHNNRHSSMPQSDTHMSGNSASLGRTRGFTLHPGPEVSNGSHYSNTISKSTMPRYRSDQSKEDYEAVENKQGKKSAWSAQIASMSHSTLHKPYVNEVRIKTDDPFSGKKYNAENTNVTPRLAVSDGRPLTSEEELGYNSVNMSNQYSRRVSLDDPPPDFSLVSRGRSMQYPTPNVSKYELDRHHSGEHWGEDETKRKPEHGTEKTHRRFAPRHPRHSRHRGNNSRKAKQEEKSAESDSGSEGRIIQRNIGLQSLHRVIEETDRSNSCRRKDSFDTLDNVLLGNVRSDGKGDDKSYFRRNSNSKRIVQDEEEEETSDDSHLLVGSAEHSSDSITKSSMSLLCHCCREQAQGTHFVQCKLVPDRKKIEKRDCRGSVDQSRSCATQKKPSATVARKADHRIKQDSPYEHNDSEDEDIPQCRSSCCCTCHKTLRFQADASGRQATHVAKRAQYSGAAPAPDTSCCWRERQSVECEAGGRGLCGACRREMLSRGDGLAPEKRSFHECYCGSRRVCYSILEDEEEAEAAAEEAQGGACGFAHAHSFCHNHNNGEWSQ